MVTKRTALPPPGQGEKPSAENNQALVNVVIEQEADSVAAGGNAIPVTAQRPPPVNSQPILTSNPLTNQDQTGTGPVVANSIHETALNQILQRMAEMENRFLLQQRLDAQRLAEMESQSRARLAENLQRLDQMEVRLRNRSASTAATGEYSKTRNTETDEPPHYGEGGGHGGNAETHSISDEHDRPQRRGREMENIGPFTNRLMNMPLPPTFKKCKVPTYDGSQDPEGHLEAFRAEMFFHGITGPILARIFATTLSGQAMSWISKLPRRSIDTFDELAQTFRLNFATSKDHAMPSYILGSIRQQKGESLRKYLDRFKKTALKVRNLIEPVHLHLIIAGLDVESPLAQSLFKKEVTTLEQFRLRSEKYLDVERMTMVAKPHDDSKDGDRQGKSQQKARKEDRPRGRRYTNYAP